MKPLGLFSTSTPRGAIHRAVLHLSPVKPQNQHQKKKKLKRKKNPLRKKSFVKFLRIPPFCGLQDDRKVSGLEASECLRVWSASRYGVMALSPRYSPAGQRISRSTYFHPKKKIFFFCWSCVGSGWERPVTARDNTFYEVVSTRLDQRLLVSADVAGTFLLNNSRISWNYCGNLWMCKHNVVLKNFWEYLQIFGIQSRTLERLKVIF